MVQVFDKVQTPLEQLNPYIQQASQQIGQGIQQSRAQNALQKILNPQQAAMTSASQSQLAPQISPMQAAQVYDLAEKAYGKNAATALANSFIEQQKSGRQEHLQERKENSARERALFKSNEPKLIETSERLKGLEAQQARFGRMGELEKNPKVFPSSISAALFSKDGQINALGSALLSPEAQEYQKLTVDSLTNAKDTFGARLTNFDVATYLKGLPGLLNTAEGRARVRRDLELMNEINQLHDRGILEIFEEKGGSDKISYSSAERLFEKKYRDELNNLKKEFINPSQKNFSALPDASQYKGKRAKDNKTGEIFMSDGSQWNPVRDAQ